MSNSKLAKSTSINEAVAGKAAPASTAKAQSVKKGSVASPSSVRSGEANRKTASNYSQSVADRVRTAASNRAKADAIAIKQYAQATYERQLALEVQSLLGEDVEDYFRFDVEDLAIPGSATAGYLQTVEVAALPSSN